MKNVIFTLCACAVLVACATSPTGRRTIKLMDASEMDAMGIAAYSQLKSKTPTTKNTQSKAYVDCVANAITQVVGGAWEVTVFEDKEPNAFALPGGKIGVHTGLLKTAKNQDQLAAVIGHEVGHVIAEHSNERASASTLAGLGMSLAEVAAGVAGDGNYATALGLLGLGTQVGVLLPFSRAHESEADLMGLVYMAKAGFDPNQSVALWQNMAAEGGGGGPEFLSTHPSDATRIANLRAAIPNVMPEYEAARRAGRTPNCKR